VHLRLNHEEKCHTVAATPLLRIGAMEQHQLKGIQKVLDPTTACKRKDGLDQEPPASAPKKPRLVFTDLQRRTLQAIFKETKRPSKEMQVTIARQLGLDPSTVSNFFMNARRRSVDKWREDSPPPGPASPGPAPAPRTVYVSGGSLVPVLSPAPLDSGL